LAEKVAVLTDEHDAHISVKERQNTPNTLRQLEILMRMAISLFHLLVAESSFTF
jgi:hypothetical protein